MSSEPESDRQHYLDEWFPNSIVSENHAPGRFAERVFEALSHAKLIQVELRNGGTRYIAIDRIELGGTPLHEEVHLRFQLVPWYSIRSSLDEVRWGGLDDPIQGSTEPVYYFSIDADTDPDRAVENLHEFVAEHLDDALVTTASPDQGKAARLTVRRAFVPGAVLLIGLTGLIMVTTVTVIQVTRHAVQLSVALAVGAAVFTALTTVGVTGAIRVGERRDRDGQGESNGHANRLGSYFNRVERISSRRTTKRDIDV